MNPLGNTDVDRYVKDLIEHNIQDEDQEDKARAGKTERGGHEANNNRPATANKGKVA